MRFNSKKLLLFSMIILILVFPNMVFAKDNSVKLTEEKISSAVNEIVKNAGSFTELIVDSGLVDTEDNTKIYFYILPVDSKAVKSSNDFSIQSVTPLSSHTIPQGVKMIYSRSDGQPWTVATTTLVSMSFPLIKQVQQLCNMDISILTMDKLYRVLLTHLTMLMPIMLVQLILDSL